jgi:hypothetical protein
MRIQIDKNEFVETDRVPTRDLRALKSQYDLDIDMIMESLDLARGTFLATGEAADPDWYARANFALRRKRKAVQELQRVLSQRNRQEKQEGIRLSDLFLDIARVRLAPAVFNEILHDAMEKQGQSHPEGAGKGVNGDADEEGELSL